MFPTFVELLQQNKFENYFRTYRHHTNRSICKACCKRRNRLSSSQALRRKWRSCWLVASWFIGWGNKRKTSAAGRWCIVLSQRYQKFCCYIWKSQSCVSSLHLLLCSQVTGWFCFTWIPGVVHQSPQLTKFPERRSERHLNSIHFKIDAWKSGDLNTWS